MKNIERIYNNNNNITLNDIINTLIEEKIKYITEYFNNEKEITDIKEVA